MKNYAVILAAGKGTRMRTEIPKCAYPLMKKPMIIYIVEALENSYEINETLLVVGHKAEVFEEMLGKRVKYAYQQVQKGTGHAVKVALPLLEDENGSLRMLFNLYSLADWRMQFKFEGHQVFKESLW